MPFPAPKYTLHAITPTSRDALEPREALDYPEAVSAAAFMLANNPNVSAVLIRDAVTGDAVTTKDRLWADVRMNSEPKWLPVGAIVAWDDVVRGDGAMRDRAEIASAVERLDGIVIHPDRRKVKQSARTAAYAAAEVLRWTLGEDSEYVDHVMGGDA